MSDTAVVEGVTVDTRHWIGGQRVASARTFSDISPIDEQPLAIPIAPIPAPQPGPGAPPPPVHNGAAHWIKLSAQQDGTFTVTNTRNGFSKTYQAKL